MSDNLKIFNQNLKRFDLLGGNLSYCRFFGHRHLQQTRHPQERL